ncbi:dTDP-4-dehydrorhamnose 3,5-epimerase [Olleya aquimaris]|uniref:dTDP-4-dehydrorhamnose 3,5-epimerase n=1 Tax=Olleya sediminilitoris TaxID=2795739 RepID=A0ABS1WHA3_9FLAO|nr:MULTISPECIES: dTDP-4-dehydrorhamnose 3,5-epimerase [Olleya]AXO80776.1 dTDP-4-dehydrorhamnose 3,5-epimerase [Olleya aquimaris]MBL7558504.1 dTDP-4-dehydrorhamnose 3,5-epimerase [Olleya sediminilitoris]
MNIVQTKLKDCYIFEPTVFGDNRGYFFESYNKVKFESLIGKSVNFIQDNEAFSNKGALRGLHFQKGEFAQAKLVRVTHGLVLDVAVDLRKDSETFLQHIAVELSSDNKKQLFVPRGFAHGYVVLSDTAMFNYKCDNVYNKASEGGVIYSDQDLKIDWKLNPELFIVSEKDKILPTIKELY